MLFDQRDRRGMSGIVIAIAALVFVIGADWTMAFSQPSTPHPPHALASSHSESSVIVDHPHAEDGSVPTPWDRLTAALPPRLSPTFAAFAVIAVAIGVMGSLARPVLAAMRGPPRPLAVVPTGQDILTRLCIVRR